MIAAAAWPHAARMTGVLLAAHALAMTLACADRARGADPEPGSPAKIAFTAHNRGDAPVELWAGQAFLGRIEPGESITHSVGVERRAADGALAIIGIDRTDADPRAEEGATAEPVYRAGVIVLPGEMAAADILTIVWGGIDPFDPAAATAIDTPGAPAHGALYEDRWLACTATRWSGAETGRTCVSR